MGTRPPLLLSSSPKSSSSSSASFFQLSSNCVVPGQNIMWACIWAALLLLASVSARPKDDEDPLQPDVSSQDVFSEQVDSWRAFEPMVPSTTHWWEEQMDNNLWDVTQYPLLGEPNSLQSLNSHVSAPAAAAGSTGSDDSNAFLQPSSSNDDSSIETRTDVDSSSQFQSGHDMHSSIKQQGSDTFKSEGIPDIVLDDHILQHDGSDIASSEEVGSEESVVSSSSEEKDSTDEEQELSNSDGNVVEDEVEESWSPVYQPGKINSFVDTDTDPFYSSSIDDFNDESWDDDTFPTSEEIPHDSVSSEDKKDDSIEEEVLEESNGKDLAKESIEDLSKNVVEFGQQVLDKSKELASKVDKRMEESHADISDGSDKEQEIVQKEMEDKKEEKMMADSPDSILKKDEEDEVKEKKQKSFQDWDDWDNKPFDEYYYDESEEDDKEDIHEKYEDIEVSNDKSDIKQSDGKVESSEENINEVKDKTHNNDINDSEEYSDEDYYNDWEYSDNSKESDENEHADDSSDSKENSNKEPSFTPTKKTKTDKQVEEMKDDAPIPGFDSMDYQGDQPMPDTDHYSKGVVYDSFYPHHKSKPSVKKDLGNPANRKYEDNLSDPLPSSKTFGDEKKMNGAAQEKPSKDEPQNSALLSKSVTHLGLNPVNTEADASTSPNPPTTWAVEATTSTPPTRLPTTTEENDLWGEDDWDFEDEDDQRLSYPIEFCKMDAECRAGRECLKGVCRCVKAETCKGHGKPVCGSDGIRYPSHCELHRTACATRRHIRIDNRGRCFKEELEEKERSWLREQEEMAQEIAKSEEIAANKSQPETYQFPGDVKSEPLPSDVKKDYNKQASESQQQACSWQEMAQFKETLLMYHCLKFVEPKCTMEVKTDRKYLSMLMFSYYDQDFDFQLTSGELDDRERDEHFSKNIIRNCHLHDFVKYADTDEDGKLAVSEFTDSFEMASPSSEKTSSTVSPVINTLATAGNGLELKCGLDTDQVVWTRQGVRLQDDQHGHQIMVFDDGALFFSKVSLHHIGNFTCMDAVDESIRQVHKLTVQTVPVLHVSPVTQSLRPGSDVDLHCHADGVPRPMITWKQGDNTVHNGGHFTIYYGHEHMVVHNAQNEEDSGTYTCSAHNQAGTMDKSVSVSILKSKEPTYVASARDMGSFVVFHSKGVTAYDPMTCLNKREIHQDFGNFKYIPDTLGVPLTLCAEGQECQWGANVAVSDSSFIYVSQPDQNRVLIMDSGDTWNPLQVIDTDSRPEKLWYVHHLDQVWVLCTNEKGRGEGGKIIMVIRDASQHIQHRAVHMRPVDNHFDLVEDVFIAPPNDLEHDFDFGYVSHVDQSSLHKLNLQDMSYAKTIDLSNYGCVPQAVAFIPIGGQIVIECVSASDQHTLQLVMDYLTDAIVSTITLAGRPLVSPDSRHLVTVDEFTGRVTVNSVSDDGILARTYEVTVSASISDTAFMPTNDQHGYSLLLSSADDDSIVTMNLVTGKVDKLPGTQSYDSSKPWHPSPVHRHIVSGSPMSNYFMVPSRSSLSIVNSRFREVDCEYLDSTGSDVMIYIPSHKSS